MSPGQRTVAYLDQCLRLAGLDPMNRPALCLDAVKHLGREDWSALAVTCGQIPTVGLTRRVVAAYRARAARLAS